KMHVIAFDPFLSDSRAEELGVEKVELDELFARADFITLHTPLTDKTRNIIDAAAIAKMKTGVRIINCARGGLVVEADLIAALKSGKVAGAGIDVFEVEPAEYNELFGMENVVATPHLGASTTEAQENVALHVAEQMSDYLIKGAVSNAINMPSITAEEAPRLKPFVKLAEVLGAFVGQVTEDPIKEVEILFDGSTATMNTRALISATLAGLIRPQVSDVNMVSAPIMVKERGIIVAEVKRDKSGVFDGYIKLTVKTEHRTRSIAGTCFSDGKPRFIQIKGINLDAEVGQHMLYTTNADAPGIIGLLGTVCGENGVNIANFQLGRNRPGGDAIALLYLDAPFPENVLAQVRSHKSIDSAKRLHFDVGAA
ncbi:MAG: phosphoglycerate dehydrogenase, partial [Mesorhizobium sp.]